MDIGFEPGSGMLDFMVVGALECASKDSVRKIEGKKRDNGQQT